MAGEQQAAVAAALGAGLSLGGGGGALASPPGASATEDCDVALQRAKHQLDLAVEAFARHEREIAELKAALAAAEQKARAAELGAGANKKIAPPLPFAAVFYPLLAQKILTAVDVCELGCVSKELSLCVREVWREAEADPGSQRRLLFVRDGGGGGASFEEEADDEEEVLIGGAADWSLAYEDGKTLITRALKEQPCSLCGLEWPLIFTYPYPFDGEPRALDPDVTAAGAGVDWRTALNLRRWPEPVLCRGCYRSTENKPPHHSRQERFRVSDWGTLVKKYGTPLPRSILNCAVKKMRTKMQKSWPIIDHALPHASVLRAANFALTLMTPRELHDHWSRPAR
jgi:hypothetical protein